MTKSTLFTTLAAAALALGLAACDEQQASNGSEPLQQQQGAMPENNDNSTLAPQSTEPSATQPPVEEPAEPSDSGSTTTQ